MDVSGQVLDPLGRPFNGARLILVGRGQKPENLGTSGADGRFTVKIPRETAEPTRFLAACAPGAGIDFAAIAGLNPARAVELRLVKDNKSAAKIVGTQGKLVAGVQVAGHHRWGSTTTPWIVSCRPGRTGCIPSYGRKRTETSGREAAPLPRPRRMIRAVWSRWNGCGAVRTSAARRG